MNTHRHTVENAFLGQPLTLIGNFCNHRNEDRQRTDEHHNEKTDQHNKATENHRKPARTIGQPYNISGNKWKQLLTITQRTQTNTQHRPTKHIAGQHVESIGSPYPNLSIRGKHSPRVLNSFENMNS